MSDLKHKVYDLVRKVPKGKVTTYKAIGDKLNTKAYRAIGQILKDNPYAPEVPCHRVIQSSGEAGGFSGSIMNQNKKIRILKKEGVKFNRSRIENFDKDLHLF